MTELLKGAAVAAAIQERTARTTAALAEKGIVPTLAILRVGERADDLSYERGAVKRCEAVGIAVRKTVLAPDCTQEELMEALNSLNTDETVHGILVFLPLPKHLDSEAVRASLRPEKDVDGVTEGSLAGVFTESRRGFAPCTAQAVTEILDFYGVDCKGKNAVVLGRSLVVGRPAAMLLLHKNATVTICHRSTEEQEKIAKAADILVVCIGRQESVGKDYLREGQTVIDVGIHWSEEKQKLCGDVRWEEADGLVAAATPVPGGVGSVTSAVLADHVAEAARRHS